MTPPTPVADAPSARRAAVAIAADAVHTPGPFVDHVVHLTELTDAYAVVER